MLDKAKMQQESLLNDTELVKMARDKANEIISIAENRAYEMKVNAFTYSDDILGKLQEKVAYLHNVIEENRQELKNM